MNSSHPFDGSIRLEALGEHRYRGSTSPDYMNMVGPFGGTIAALMLQAPCIAPERLGDPTALTVNFCGAIADGSFDITAHAMRTNRSSQHWSIVLTQKDETVVTASAVFAKRRPTWRQTEARFPDVPAAAQVERASNAFRPPWTRRYDMRFVRGSCRTSAKPGREMRRGMRQEIRR